MPVFGVAKFERFFRAAGANGRDIVEPWDLPVTKGLHESMYAFRKLDEEIDLEPILGRLATYPPLDRVLSEETETRLPAVVGALSVALARTFRVIDPDVRNPRSEHWERVFQVFDQLI